MKWITREKIKVDRVACPWLIKKFIDPDAEFVFLPRETDWSKTDNGIVSDLLSFFSRKPAYWYKGTVYAMTAVTMTATVQPGIVLDELNRRLKGTGWHFPVDVSTSANATIGGMASTCTVTGLSIEFRARALSKWAFTPKSANVVVKRDTPRSPLPYFVMATIFRTPFGTGRRTESGRPQNGRSRTSVPAFAIA